MYVCTSVYVQVYVSEYHYSTIFVRDEEQVVCVCVRDPGRSRKQVVFLAVSPCFSASFLSMKYLHQLQ